MISALERKNIREELKTKEQYLEFVRVKEVFEMYKFLTEANMKNKQLVKNSMLTRQALD